MSDSAERKIKLLLLYEILLKQTDELHPMTTSEIFTALQESGVAVSRQTLYEDIEVLNRYGFEVICLKGKENQYYISSRTFERPEAEILLQAVCSSDFLSKKKKYELLNKVGKIGGIWEYGSVRPKRNGCIFTEFFIFRKERCRGRWRI